MVLFFQRHRLINDLVKTKLQGNFVHALSIEAKTPAQWDQTYKVEPSPNCRGGFGKWCKMFQFRIESFQIYLFVVLILQIKE